MKIILTNEEREHYKKLAEEHTCIDVDCEHCQIDKMTANKCDNERYIAQFILENEAKSDS